MIVIQGYFKLAPENVAKLREAAAPLIAGSRAEPGNIAYAFAEDFAEPGIVHIIERWESDEALAAHNATPHFAAFMGVVPSLGITGVRVARYDADDEKVLSGG